MIKNIVFDFGDVFINLDKQVVINAMIDYGVPELTTDFTTLNNSFEIGSVSPEEFLNELHASFSAISKQEIAQIWNAMLLDFPDYRLEFLEDLAKENHYRLFLLSNTNALHIPHVQVKMGQTKYERFKNSFEGFHLSHEIQLRKPNYEVFEFVLNTHNLKAHETLFVDDTKENTLAAATLGIHTWNLKVGTEDVIELKSKL